MPRKFGSVGNTVRLAGEWDEMSSLLPHANIMDCTEMMDRVRWIKTPEEVKMFEKGGAALGRGVSRGLPYGPPW